MIRTYWQIPHDTVEDKNAIQQSNTFLSTLEANHVKGSLVYFHHTSLDPWVIATAIIQHTKHHIPLIAVQPYTMLPSTVATMIHSIYHIYHRKVNLNFITGNSLQDLQEVGNKLDKNERYERLAEFAQIVRLLLSSNEPLTFKGKYYEYAEFRHLNAVPSEMIPEFFVPTQSGSVEAIKVIAQVADVAVTIPRCLSQLKANFIDRLKPHSLRLCVKLQIVTRPTYEEAVAAAKSHERYNFRMSQIAKAQEKKSWQFAIEENDVYFPSVGPFGPTILGSYDQVRSYLSKYFEMGVSNFIISNMNDEELPHINEVFHKLK
ncbi:LLM class flavin-dependent oxidoreductase [Paenibacillus tyrfis]|uniref:Luciferase-like domain-containing protein n=1 Tax=Paenibacillus tyrfis TaxID=1501230 RepID=A0A081NTM9_9BACL|nr:LLM class flavin-dependent oxidoreductase [Paenibacillus tyrfis]KEQ21802.1 hypothetical protein ET33_30790 [Paenibacillus tyrfis]